LFDKQLAVTENYELFRTKSSRSFEGFYETCIFGHVVSRSAYDVGFCQQLSPAGIVQNKTGSSRARIASAAAVYMSDDFIGHYVSSSKQN
jgi:hypothetical protein